MDSTLIMEMSFLNSNRLIEKACKVIPEGVSSPGRKFSEVRASPIYITSGKDAYVYDVDKNKYVDFMNGLGPIILGHAHPAISEAISRQAEKGSVFGVSNELEIELAEKIVESSTGIEQIRFVCSGTEATMSAVRLAKYFTGRDKIVKFRGSYHGHADPLMGNGMKIHDLKMKGVDQFIHNNTLICNYNDENQLEDIFTRHGHEISSIIIEPISSNMGLVKPNITFIQMTRRLCDKYGALLIFDEVVTGFRFRYGSIAPNFNIVPDLFVFGKIIGGGTPVGAYGGRKDIMEKLENDDFFQGGTFAANPITMAAGNATLNILQKNDVYEHIDSLGELLCSELNSLFRKKELHYHADSAGSLVSLILSIDIELMKNLDDNSLQDRDLFSELHYHLLREGFMLAPTIDEPLFISYAHTERHINDLVSAISIFFK